MNRTHATAGIACPQFRQLLALVICSVLLCCQRKTSGVSAVSSVAAASTPRPVNSAAPTVLPAETEPTATEPVAPSEPEVLFIDRPSPEPAKQAEKQRCVVAAIGDSLTDPKGPSGGLYLKNLKRRLPRSEFHNFGRGGNMVNQMRRRFEADVFHRAHPNYTHVVVFGGVNDLYSDQTAGRKNELIQADLSTMYEIARKRGAQVVAITVAPWGGFSRYFNARRGKNTRLLNDWILHQRPGLIDVVVDLHPLLSCGDHLCPKFAAPHKDGLHMGPEAHAVLAEALHQSAFAQCL